MDDEKWKVFLMIDVKNNTKKVWGASPAGAKSSSSKPMTFEFFKEAYDLRCGYEIPWLNEVVSFDKYRDKRVLEIGCGAGFDAYNILKNGGMYTGIDITPENTRRTKKHLSFYNFKPTVIEADAEKLPFIEGSFDAVFSNGVLHHTPDIKRSFDEVYRALSHEGEFCVVLYHKNSIFYWITLFLFDHIFYFGFIKRRFSDRLSQIEFTTSSVKPLVNVYTKKELKKLLTRSGFRINNDSIKIRKLVREDLPHPRILRGLWKYIPQNTYDYVGSKFGWYIIAKVRK